MVGAVVLAAALLAAAGGLAYVLARGPSAPASMQDRIRAVASTLRCPACQDLSVADSPSRLAQELRAEIGQQLRAGRTPDQVRRFYVDRYGEWVLLSPPRAGINLVAWLAPGLLLLGGLVVAGVAIRRWTIDRSGALPSAASRASPQAELAPADRALLERALSSMGDDPE